MKVRILGCHGSEYPGFKTTCILINDYLTIDAGALTSFLSLEEQAKVRHIVLTHSHLDHVLDIGFFADNVIGRIANPVEIHGTQATLGALMKHMLNNKIWPDFTRIPTAVAPVLKTQKIKLREEFTIDELTIRAVPVNHTTQTVGYIISEKDGPAIAISGDTGPTKELWNVVNKTPNIKAVFIETSFPNKQTKAAMASKHLTPAMMFGEMQKVDRYRSIPFYLYHMKPLFIGELAKDVKALKLNNVSFLETGQYFIF